MINNAHNRIKLISHLLDLIKCLLPIASICYLNVSSLILGAFVFLKTDADSLTSRFFYVCLSITIWTVGFTATITAASIDSADILGEISLYWRYLYTGFFNRFILALINQYPKSKLFLAGEILLCGFLLFLLKIGWLIEGVNPSTILQIL